MLGRLSNSLRRSSRSSKRPPVSSKNRKSNNSNSASDRPYSSHGGDSSSGGGRLKPPESEPSRRARSHEIDRRQSYESASAGRDHDDEYYHYHQYYPPRASDNRRRSVSPRQRRPPSQREERRLRRRSTREADFSADEDNSRTLSPSSPRGSPRYPADRAPRRSEDRPPPPVAHPESRPVVKQYPPDSYRPVDRRRMSYDGAYARPPPGTYGKTSPPGHRPSGSRSNSREDARRPHHPDSRLSTDRIPQRPQHPDARLSSDRVPQRPQHPDSRRSSADRVPQRPKPQSRPKPAAEPPKKPSGRAQFWEKIPQTLATFGGLEALTKHADTAKEWADWLNDLQGAPEEIQALSAKATTARDTITQIQQSLEMRPDLVEGESGQFLKQQINAAVKSTDASLEEMTKLLQELSNDGPEGTVIRGLQDFYNSYKYKHEWEGKIKEAEANLQAELATLSTLMVNIYSRALMKPAPGGSTANVPPPSPIKPADKDSAQSKPAKEEKPAPSGSSNPEIPIITTTPPPPRQTNAASREAPTSEKPSTESVQTPPVSTNEKSPKPPSPSAVGREEARIDSAGASQKPQPPPTTTDQPKPDMGGTGKEPKGKERDDSPASGSHDDHEVALLDAAWNGDLDAVNRELHHASAMTRDLQGLTPLHLAVERDHLATAMLLRDHRVDPEARDNNGRTPLHLAARFGSAATVEFLLEKCRADPNARTLDGRTPLHYAALSAVSGDEERRDVLRVLREWGSDPLVVDAKGRTPRDCAQQRDFWDAAATLRRTEEAWSKKGRKNWFQRHGFKK